MQRRRPNPRVRRAAQQEPDRHDDGPLSGRGESTGRYARIYAGRPPSPAGDGPATEHAGRHEGLGLLLTSHRFAIGLGIAACWPIVAADAMA